MSLKEFLERGGEYFLPNLSIDLVIIGYQDNKLKCLLLQMKDKWLLPGGYIGREESVGNAAVRILKYRTGLEDPHLKFLSVFGDQNRKYTREWKELIERSGLPWKDEYWLNARFVTLVYYSLVNIDQTYPKVRGFDESFAWFNFDDLPNMWMDHKSISVASQKLAKGRYRAGAGLL